MGIMDILVDELNKGKTENESKWERLHSEQYEIVQTKNGCFHNPIKTSKKEKVEPELKTYKAEFADEEMEIFTAETNSQAIDEAYKMEKEHGNVWNIYLLDEDYNEIETIF
jgi:hypothetical protein